jgi:transitional endoplasmic reticulum ATPase
LQGDKVLLKGKKGRETICVVVLDENVPKGVIRMNRNVRDNLASKVGNLITLIPAPEIPLGKHISVLPYADSVEGITGDLFETYIKSYFADKYRPVHEGDTITCRNATSSSSSSVDFKIVKTFFINIYFF